jgi:hypothetical protein
MVRLWKERGGGVQPNPADMNVFGRINIEYKLL